MHKDTLNLRFCVNKHPLVCSCAKHWIPATSEIATIQAKINCQIFSFYNHYCFFFTLSDGRSQQNAKDVRQTERFKTVFQKGFHVDMNFKLILELNLDLRDLFHHLCFRELGGDTTLITCFSYISDLVVKRIDIASISPHYYCKFGNTARSAQQGLWTIISRVETETEIPSLQVAEQGKWRGREGKCNQAPHNVNTGDRALIGVQHSLIQLYLTTSSITASLSLKSQMSAWWRCTHLHVPGLQIPVHYCPADHWQTCHSPWRWMLLLGHLQTLFFD